MEAIMLRIKYSVGIVGFEAEGTVDDVNKQREEFIDNVLPNVIKVMKQDLLVKETAN